MRPTMAISRSTRVDGSGTACGLLSGADTMLPTEHTVLPSTLRCRQNARSNLAVRSPERPMSLAALDAVLEEILKELT